MPCLGLILMLSLYPPVDSPDIVDNGRLPAGARITLKFEEDLRIGPDSGDHALWSGASITVDTNKKGHIFVTDPGGNRVLHYDASGNLVKQIGGPGEGPGEFQFLGSFKILNNQTAIAFDNLQTAVSFNYFDAETNYLKSDKRSSFGFIIKSAVFSPNGKQFGGFYMIPEGDSQTIKAYTGLLSSACEPLKPLSEVTLNRFDQTKMNNPSWWGPYLSQWFRMVAGGVGIFAFGQEGDVFTATSGKYEITRWSSDLKQKKQVICRDYKPIGQGKDQVEAMVASIKDELLTVIPAMLHDYVTDRAILEGLELAEMPEHKPPLFWVIPTEDDGLLAIHDYNPLTGASKADIFDKAGVFVGTTDLPPIKINFFGSVFGNNTKMIFANGYAYAIEDNDDEAVMVRYKVSRVSAR